MNVPLSQKSKRDRSKRVKYILSNETKKGIQRDGERKREYWQKQRQKGQKEELKDMLQANGEH